ncbi:putative Pre-mRNA-processing factor 39 protein [Naja naja]|nr:putative Pre-mRNA-processing factor 39 protein [Naja naja]
MNSRPRREPQAHPGHRHLSEERKRRSVAQDGPALSFPPIRQGEGRLPGLHIRVIAAAQAQCDIAEPASRIREGGRCAQAAAAKMAEEAAEAPATLGRGEAEGVEELSGAESGADKEGLLNQESNAPPKPDEAKPVQEVNGDGLEDNTAALQAEPAREETRSLLLQMWG